MKNIKIFILVLLFLWVGISGVSATPVLYDWGIDVAGTYYNAADIYMPPTVGGEITGVSGFNMFTPPGDPYGYAVPEAIGTIDVTFNPGIAGTYNIDTWFDVEIDEWDNTYFNESGAAIGAPAVAPPGDQYGGAVDANGDIWWYTGWDFDLAASETATVSLTFSDVIPTGFYLSQTDDDTGEMVYLSSTLSISGGPVNPVPEPATLLLLGTGLVGLAGFGRKKFRYNS